MTVDQGIPIVSHAIQLAIAPVFLVTGIAGLLGVMANRLARVIDRARVIEQAWKEMDEEARVSAREELDNLERRRHLVSWSINFCTSAALLVCLVIVTLFLDEFFTKDFRWFAGVLFVSAMFLLIGGLASFLREVHLATRVVRIDAAHLASRADR
jgi:uncharacterized protein DUF2721